MHLVRRQSPANGAHPIQDTIVALREHQPPVGALDVFGVHLVQGVVGCILVGVDEEPIAGEQRAGHRVHTGVDGDEPPLGMPAIEEVDLAAHPALRDLHDQPAAIVRERHVRPVFARAPGAEDLFILAPILAEGMEEDVAVVHLLTLRHGAWDRNASHVEAAVVRQPGDAGCAGVRDHVGGEVFTAAEVQDAQRAQLGAAL